MALWAAKFTDTYKSNEIPIKHFKVCRSEYVKAAKLQRVWILLQGGTALHDLIETTNPIRLFSASTKPAQPMLISSTITQREPPAGVQARAGDVMTSCDWRALNHLIITWSMLGWIFGPCVTLAKRYESQLTLTPTKRSHSYLKLYEENHPLF